MRRCEYLRHKKGSRYIEVITSQFLNGPHSSFTGNGRVVINNQRARTEQRRMFFFGEVDTSRLQDETPLPAGEVSMQGIQPVEEAVADTYSCVVCLENRTTTIILPCGHMCCCRPCVRRLSACPYCRTEISQIMHVYRVQ